MENPKEGIAEQRPPCCQRSSLWSIAWHISAEKKQPITCAFLSRHWSGGRLRGRGQHISGPDVDAYTGSAIWKHF